MISRFGHHRAATRPTVLLLMVACVVVFTIISPGAMVIMDLQLHRTALCGPSLLSAQSWQWQSHRRNARPDEDYSKDGVAKEFSESANDGRRFNVQRLTVV